MVSIVIVITVLSLLGTYLHGLIAGVRVALRFILPLIAVAIALMVILTLFSRADSGRES